MSMLKAVMVDLRAWNNCLVALNMWTWLGGHLMRQPGGGLLTLGFILIAG